MPTNTLTRHVPPAEVNCGFTYIGVLFNFLTLKKGEMPEFFIKRNIWEYHGINFNTQLYLYQI